MIEEPRIAVVGHLVADEIIYAGGDKTLAPGGISYNLAALISVMDRGRIIPVCEVGSDYEETYSAYFGGNGLIDSSFIRKIDLPNVVNRLVYDGEGGREEWNSRIPERLSLADIDRGIDAALINFISGDDLSAEELSDFRNRYEGVIFCDYHSLALGRDPAGKRFYRKHPGWEKYLSAADIAQMNIAELTTLCDLSSLNFGDIMSACRAIHSLRAGMVIITLGKNGAVLSLEAGKSAYHLPSLPVDNEIDPTGCGDTFAAVFLYYYLITGNPLKSAAIANRYAAAKAAFAGIDGFRSLDSVLRSLGPEMEPVKIK
jgi:adenosine kinase